jgi:hypothetical protein
MNENPTIHPAYKVTAMDGESDEGRYALGADRLGYVRAVYEPDRPAAPGYEDSADEDGNDIYAQLAFQMGWLGIDRPATDVEVIKVGIAVILMDTLHECFEFANIDGERVADPHPEEEGEQESWSLMMKGFLDVIDTYCEKFPLTPDNPRARVDL